MRFHHILIALLLGSFALLTLAPEPAKAQFYRGYGGPFYGPVYGGPVYYGCQPAPAYYAPYYAAPMYYQPRFSYAPTYYQPVAPKYSPAKPTTIINIAASDDYFDPAAVDVQPGTTVKWVNKGQHKHTITSITGLWDSGDLAGGASYSATFNAPGTYSYYCRHHKGMKGTITVGGGGANPAGGYRGPSGY
jgi:plastocyanin